MFKENPLLFLFVIGVSIGFLVLAVFLFIKLMLIKRASKRCPIWMPLGLIVGMMGFVGGLMFLTAWSSNRQVSFETAEAPAELISSEYVSGSRKMDKHYRIKYRYTVNGQIYEGSINPRADSKYAETLLREKAKLKACYNPANPNESNIWQSEFQCGSKPDW